ncbi:SigB/SigF/SigG family RNA polymerase sigma factor [Kitasatospora sp. NPDC048407]|uniref:SigB/SigF/SigG family RNA polymerase sigma factor n=1 Tax=Kitasatospora sp. NPDC048407 TaxID=3364051 RepID=UPI00371B6919
MAMQPRSPGRDRPRTDAGRVAYCEDLPVVDNPRSASTAEARELTNSLIIRLRECEEGTAEYSYIRGTVIELNLSLVKYAARRYRNSHVPMDDIVQTGTIGLIKAIDRFDTTRGVAFTTFALPTITGEMRRLFRDTTWALHVPRRAQELRLAVAAGRDDLEQALGRAPTDAELAEHLDVSEDEVRAGAAAADARTADSLDAPTDGGDPDSSLQARLGRCDPRLAAVEDIEALRPLIALLPQRERRILALRFTGELTQAEIGRCLGISQMQVSRLLARTLQSLRTGLGEETP